MPISKDEFAELRASGLSVRQIASLDEENARAMIRGYQRGQEAMQGSPESRLDPEVMAAPEVPSMSLQESLRARLGPMEEEPQTRGPAPWWIDALPAVGGTFGGIVGGAAAGAPTGGIAAIPGAAAGAGIGTAGGEAYRQLLARAFGYDAPASSGEAASRIGSEGLQSALIAGGTVGLGQGANLLARTPILKHMVPFAGRIRAMGDEVAEYGGRLGRAVTQKIGSAASRVAGAADEASEAGRALAKKRWSAPKPSKARPKGKPDLKVVEKPRVGSAESRVKGETAPKRAKRLRQRQKDNRRHPNLQEQPQIQVGSDLEARLAQAVKVEQHMTKLGFTDAEKALVRQQLMQQ